MIHTITELLKNRMDPNNIDYSKIIKTGFENIDTQIGGIKKGELVVLGGRPGMGSTTFAIQLGIQIAKQGTDVLYSSVHEDRSWLENKILSQLLKKQFSEVNNPLFENEILGKKDEVLEQVKSLSLSVSCNLKRTSDLINAIESNYFEVVIIDLVQSMSAGFNNQKEDIESVMKSLKEIAVENNILIIAISSLSRRLEKRGGDRRPMLGDLRGSGLIEQLADKVLFLYRPDYYDISEDENGNSLRNYIELIVSLNKTGKTCSLVFKINDSFSYLTPVR